MGEERFRDRLWVSLLRAAPLRAYGRAVRMASDVEIPRGLRPLIFGKFAERLGMNLSEAEHDISEYPSFGAFFTRRLRDDARPLAEDASTIVSPVDGQVSAVGLADGERLLQAKGLDYSLRELLGSDELTERLVGGPYLTLYLRPKDYHRIHAPLAGAVRSCRRWPGTVYPVQPSFLRHVPGLFVRNERLVLELETELGLVAVVFVGAAAVAEISTPFEDGSVSHLRFMPPISVDRGAEIGTFNLGSTVILIFQPESLELAPLGVGDEVRVGQIVARRGHASL